MMPALVESDRYYFDAEAADRPIRFAAKYLRHYEGRFAGQPFKFLPWQEDITRALFGWKKRADGLRRFRELYLLTAKGSGKTPWLSAIGMYMLLTDGEQGAHVMSCATDFPQAFLTLDAAKKYVAADPALAKQCRSIQFEIRAPRSNSKWTVLSGTAEGKHGFRPSCLLMDEAHEWPNGKLYNNLTANMPKRQQPLCLVATNAGENEHSFCYQLHRRAERAMKGQGEDTLLPVIFEAPRNLDWTSEAAAAAANPSQGAVVSFEQVRPELEKAKQSDEGKDRYCRLYLSWWQKTGEGRWLDMSAWDACMAGWKDPPADSPLYVGLDLAQSDDLCAALWVYPARKDDKAGAPGRLIVDAKFWLPRSTAERYQTQNSVPYREWADAGWIELLDQPTIDAAARRKIADEVIARGAGRTIKAVTYDRYKADETVAILEASGITCVPIAQGYSVSPGAHDLERRIKEQSISLSPNRVLRFCAENAEAKTDDRGNLWVAKPAAKGKFAGTRWKKVDGISALVTALVEARKYTFPAARKRWTGTVQLV